MKARALLVPLHRGETARRTLREAGLLRTDLEIGHESGLLALPLVAAGAGAVPPGLGEEGERDFHPRSSRGPSDYRELVEGSAEERARFPRSFDVVGDIVLVRIPPELDSRAREIGAALLAFVPGARIVGRDRGVHGPARRRRLDALAGTGSWRTRHRENGLEFEVDLERAYFSPRLAREHALVAAEVCSGDRVYDLCCGVGPFSLAIARDGRASRVTAVDSNADAIGLLRETLGRLSLGERVAPVERGVEAFVAGAEPVERVILNLPHEGIKYLPSVARAVAHRGRLYYYEVTPRTEIERRGETIVGTFERPAEWRVVSSHVVHPYSPTAELVAFVFERSGPDGPS